MFKIDDESTCWCASGKQYKYCCGILHQLIKETGLEPLREACIKEENYMELLKVDVAEFVQYLIWVKSHTEPLMLKSPKYAKSLIEIDVKALSELLDRILATCKNYDLEYDFLRLINRSKEFFFCSKWHKKVEFYLLIWISFYKNDLDKAIQYIKDNIDINSVNDHELLELIIDVYSEELTISEKLDICHRIQELNNDPLKVSHYITVEGIEYLLLNDEKKAIELFEKSIDIIEKSPQSSDPFNNQNIGKAYSLLGAIKSDESLISKAINQFRSLVSRSGLSSMGISQIYWEIGSAYASLGKYDEAIENYNAANELPIALIDMANIYICRQDYVEAKNILDKIDYASLSGENKIDFLFIYSKILCFQCNEKIDFIITEIKNLDLKIGVFRDNAQKILISLYEIKASENVVVLEEKKRNWFDNINDAVMLQPNIAGFGFNINKIIELIRNRKSQGKKSGAKNSK